MCQNLGLIPEEALFKEYNLSYLRDLISSHQAFDQRSNLEILGEKYGIDFGKP